jgi:hypothetical protein
VQREAPGSAALPHALAAWRGRRSTRPRLRRHHRPNVMWNARGLRCGEVQRQRPERSMGFRLGALAGGPSGVGSAGPSGTGLLLVEGQYKDLERGDAQWQLGDSTEVRWSASGASFVIGDGDRGERGGAAALA